MNYDRYIIGIDLGQAQDWTAIIVDGVNVAPNGWGEDESDFTSIHINRPPLRTSYLDIVESLNPILKKLEEAGCSDPSIVVDKTGVGAGVVEMFEARYPDNNIISINITGGNEAREIPHENLWNVPKKLLVSALQISLQNGNQNIPAKLPNAQLLIREMENFKAKITTKTETFEAWREEGTNDDLVLAKALIAWYGSIPEQKGAW